VAPTARQPLLADCRGVSIFDSDEFDAICDLREEWESTLSPTDYRARIDEQVAAMAPGQTGRAELLAARAEVRWEDQSDDELAAAERSMRAAIDDGGPTYGDPRVRLLEILLRRSRDDEADTLVRECLRRSSPQNVLGAGLDELGEALEAAGDLRRAQRAFTVGLREFEPSIDEPDADEHACLTGRYRVRRALGLGLDAFDRAFREIDPDTAAAIDDPAAE
jgi:hypothetical protein